MVRMPRTSWLPLTVTSFAVAASALWVALTPVEEQTELAGRTWQEVARQDPEVASLYAMDLVVLGLLGAGFGVLATVISAVPYRRGERWAWYALWLVPITIGAVAGRMLLDHYSAAWYYAGLTAVALVALLLPIRDVVRPRGSEPQP